MISKKSFGFTIKITPNKLNSKRTYSKNRVSRRCLATVINNNGVLNAKIPMTDKEDNDDFYIMPFTEKSLELKGKHYVFAKNKDEYGHRICIIRDSFVSKHSPGTTDEFEALKEGLLISGVIIRMNGKLYFEYEDLIAFNEFATHINSVRIDSDKPIMLQ